LVALRSARPISLSVEDEGLRPLRETLGDHLGVERVGEDLGPVLERAALTYTWATTGTPPAAVTFSPNGTNAAKDCIATFTKAGAYTLQATIRDVGGATVTASVAVTANQTLTSVSIALDDGADYQPGLGFAEKAVRDGRTTARLFPGFTLGLQL
jgi:hypothetical protein